MSALTWDTFRYCGRLQAQSGRVVSFEAAPRNVTLIENNIRQNRLSERIRLVPKAAGNHSGTIAFDAGPAEQTGWGGISSTVSATTIDVPLVRLDQELPDSPIDVLKIDVEGADTWVLLGCEALLKKKQIGTIFFEQNNDRMGQLGIDVGEAKTFLRDLDYTCVPLEETMESGLHIRTQNRPNHVQPTAGRRTPKFSMTKPFHVRATHALASGR